MRAPRSVDELRRVAKIVDKNATDFVFVVMSFSGNPILETYYEEGVSKVITEIGLRPVRIDKEQFDGSITEQIKQNLENARLVIVDTTEDRPNCYFEAGYAVAKQKQIIWIRLNAPPYSGADLHFDIKDYPHILYKTASDLRKQLGEKIRFFLKL
jgi:hypothetical protein